MRDAVMVINQALKSLFCLLRVGITGRFSDKQTRLNCAGPMI